MAGGIYSSDRCPICGGRMVDNHTNAVVCPEHPEQHARSLRVQFKGVDKRFKDNYKAASKTLTGWRYKWDEGIWDERDYRKDNPNGFNVLSSTWLDKREIDVKKGELSKRQLTNIKNYILRSVTKFKGMNVKLIDDLQIEQYDNELSLEVKNKTRLEYLVCLKGCLTWIKEKYLAKTDWEVPKFPSIKAAPSPKKIVVKPDQRKILEELRKVAPEKVYMAILWLATYPKIRPKELVSVLECDFDFAFKQLVINEHKTVKDTGPKRVDMLDEDLEWARSKMRPDTRDLPFFRVEGKRTRFGHDMLWYWWCKAAQKAGFHDVDLYRGTKTSTVTDLYRWYSREDLHKATGISSQSLNNYIQENGDVNRELYARARGKVINFEKVKEG